MWQNITESFIIPGELTLSLFTALVMSLLLSFFIAMIYRNTHRGMNYEPAFLTTLVLITPVVALVMFFIRGDLVLSLGLIGSLAIIRFRTPIKDTRDMVYLFWAIVVGLGCGTENWTLALLATVFIAIIIFLLFLFEYGRPKHADFVLVMAGSSDNPGAETKELIEKYSTRSRIRSQDLVDDGWEVVYELRFSKAQEETAVEMIAALKAIDGVQKVTLLAPQLALPM
jgi:signal transduction histidine kinase